MNEADANVEIARRGYELFAGGDLDGVAQLFATEAEVYGDGGLGLDSGGSRQGPAGFIRAVEEVTEAFEDYRVEPQEFTPVADCVVVTVRISGTGRGSWLPMEVRLAHLWAYREGKVVLGEV